jgi:hypothetical protein
LSLATNPTLDTKQTRIVKKTVPTESFFNFFSPPKAPTEDDDDDAESDIEERLELDYQLGEDIKEKLIPRAIDWFTGEALAFEEISDDELDGADFDDDDDEDEDDLSEENDDEEESDDDVRYLAANPLLIFRTKLTFIFRMSLASPSRRLLSANRAERRDRARRNAYSHS